MKDRDVTRQSIDGSRRVRIRREYNNLAHLIPFRYKIERSFIFSDGEVESVVRRYRTKAGAYLVGALWTRRAWWPGRCPYCDRWVWGAHVASHHALMADAAAQVAADLAARLPGSVAGGRGGIVDREPDHRPETR